VLFAEKFQMLEEGDKGPLVDLIFHLKERDKLESIVNGDVKFNKN